MKPFTDYAAIYDVIGQSAFSERMATQVLARLRARGWGDPPHHGRRVLDLACGTGAAALVFAAAGCRVVGIDRSLTMLREARFKAERSTYDVHFLRGDLRRLMPNDSRHPPHERLLPARRVFSMQRKADLLEPQSFQLITCLNSLNHLIEDDDIHWLCEGVAAFLRPGGLFMFDRVAEAEYVTWYERDDVVYEDHNYLVYNRLDYDPQRQLATRRIVWFTREIERWWRNEETHTERAWRDDEVRTALASASLELLACEALEGEREPRVVYYGVKRESPASLRAD